MKVILHVITGLDGGGAERLLYTFLSKVAAGPNRHVVVSMTDDGEMGEPIRRLGLPVYTLGMRRGVPSLGAILEFWRVLGEVKPGIIQSWMYHANLLAALVRRSRRVPIVWCLHATGLEGNGYGIVSRWTRKACVRLSRLPHVVVANSNATFQYHYHSGYRARRWEIIPNGFDTSQFKPRPSARRTIRHELGMPQESFVIGLFSRHDPMKDHSTFFRAASIFAKSEPTAYFVMAGEGVTDENPVLSSLVEKTSLGDRVRLIGFREDIQEVTAALDVATSTSAFGESFSNTTAEAMASEVPCVVTDLPAVRELIGNTGMVVPLRSPEALVSAWQKLFDLGEDGRKRLGEAGRRRIEECFAIERMVRSYDVLYDSLLV